MRENEGAKEKERVRFSPPLGFLCLLRLSSRSCHPVLLWTVFASWKTLAGTFVRVTERVVAVYQRHTHTYTHTLVQKPMMKMSFSPSSQILSCFKKRINSLLLLILRNKVFILFAEYRTNRTGQFDSSLALWKFFFYPDVAPCFPQPPGRRYRQRAHQFYLPEPRCLVEPLQAACADPGQWCSAGRPVGP